MNDIPNKYAIHIATTTSYRMKFSHAFLRKTTVFCLMAVKETVGTSKNLSTFLTLPSQVEKFLLSLTNFIKEQD